MARRRRGVDVRTLQPPGHERAHGDGLDGQGAPRRATTGTAQIKTLLGSINSGSKLRKAVSLRRREEKEGKGEGRERGGRGMNGEEEGTEEGASKATFSWLP